MGTLGAAALPLSFDESWFSLFLDLVKKFSHCTKTGENGQAVQQERHHAGVLAQPQRVECAIPDFPALAHHREVESWDFQRNQRSSVRLLPHYRGPLGRPFPAHQ